MPHVFASTNPLFDLMPFERPERRYRKKPTAASTAGRPQPFRGDSYVREDDGWLMMEVAPGRFVGQPPAGHVARAANDNEPAISEVAMHWASRPVRNYGAAIRGKASPDEVIRLRAIDARLIAANDNRRAVAA